MEASNQSQHTIDKFLMQVKENGGIHEKSFKCQKVEEDTSKPFNKQSEQTKLVLYGSKMELKYIPEEFECNPG